MKIININNIGSRTSNQKLISLKAAYYNTSVVINFDTFSHKIDKQILKFILLYGGKIIDITRHVCEYFQI